MKQRVTFIAVWAALIILASIMMAKTGGCYTNPGKSIYNRLERIEQKIDILMEAEK